MKALMRLSLLSVFRQPVALLAFIVYPALLVFVVGDAFGKFSGVLGTEGGHSSGNHAGHFTILATIWAAGITTAVVTVVALTEAAAADRRLQGWTENGRWPRARLAGLFVMTLLCVAVSVTLWCLRAQQLVTVLWISALINATLYLFIGHIVSRYAADALSGIGLVSSVWILDALVSPSMIQGAWWPYLVSPFYAAEKVAMADRATVADVIAILGWAAVLTAAATRGPIKRRIRLAPAEIPRRLQRRSPAIAEEPRSGANVITLLTRDLVRNRSLLAVAIGGPLMLMLSSLWLFRGIEVAVPAMQDGHRVVLGTTMSQLHAAYMGLIAVVSFSGTAGFLIAGEVDRPDRRLRVAVGRLAPVTAFRLVSLAVVAMAVTVGAVLLVGVARAPNQWGWFVLVHFLAALTFACFGYVIGLVCDRVSGILIMMLFPFVDVGIAQDYMLGPVLPGWAPYLPAHPFAQLTISSAYGDEVFSTGYLYWCLGFVALGIVAVVAVTWRRTPGSRALARRPPDVRTGAPGVFSSVTLPNLGKHDTGGW